MLPLWIVLLVAILAIVVVYLYWRLRQCKCGLMEGFETTEGKEAETIEKTDTEDTKDSKESTDSKEAVDTDGKEAETVDTSDIEPEKKKDAKDATKTNTEKDQKEASKPDTGASAAATAAAKKLGDQFMNYGEMKIFNSLRDNAYSLNDIKRMIREGEINEKMIEKFLARVEAMEDGSGASKPVKTAPVIEGFTQAGYASALFA